MVPERISLKRSFATAAHFWSISFSGGFKLFSSESTTWARISTGSEMAAAIKSSVFRSISFQAFNLIFPLVPLTLNRAKIS